MEDFIYILALIAWVAYAIYRQGQKKKEAQRRAQPAPYHEEQKQEGQFKTLEEILFGEETRVPEPVMVEEAEEEGQSLEKDFEKPVSLEEVYLKKQQEMASRAPAIVSYESKKSILLEEESDHEDRSEMMQEWLSEFDLRKAVIYAEILRRPYD